MPLPFGSNVWPPILALVLLCVAGITLVARLMWSLVVPTEGPIETDRATDPGFIPRGMNGRMENTMPEYRVNLIFGGCTTSDCFIVEADTITDAFHQARAKLKDFAVYTVDEQDHGRMIYTERISGIDVKLIQAPGKYRFEQS